MSKFSNLAFAHGKRDAEAMLGFKPSHTNMRGYVAGMLNDNEDYHRLKLRVWNKPDENAHLSDWAEKYFAGWESVIPGSTTDDSWEAPNE